MSTKPQYIVVLFPEAGFSHQVEEFRQQIIHDTIVDSLLPHVTIKGRFSMKDGHKISEITEILECFPLSRFELGFEDVTIFGDAFVLLGGSEYLNDRHNELIDLLGGMVESIMGDFEKSHYRSHLTLFRINDSFDIPKISQDATKFFQNVVFSRIRLYEIVAGNQAKLITSKTLK